MPVVSIDEINAALRLDLQNDGGSPVDWTDERMLDVERTLADAEDIVRVFLKVEATAWPPDEIPDRYKRAIILAFKALFDDEQDWISALQDSPPSGPIAALLRFDRVPTIA